MRKIMQNGLIDIKLDIYCTLHNRETLVHLFNSRLLIEAHKGQPIHVTAMGWSRHCYGLIQGAIFYIMW